MALPRVGYGRLLEDFRFDFVQGHTAGTNAGATATVAAVAAKKTILYGLVVWSDIASVVNIKVNAAVIWSFKIAANTPYTLDLTRFPITTGINQALDVQIVSSTAACDVNISTFTL